MDYLLAADTYLTTKYNNIINMPIFIWYKLKYKVK